MPKADLKMISELEAEIAELQHQLYEATETIEAIRKGEIDALVVEGEYGNELYTLKTADHAYRVIIEKMAEGAVTLNRQGFIIYCNSQFANMVEKPLESVIGFPFESFITRESIPAFHKLFESCWKNDCKEEIYIKDGHPIPVQLSLTALELQDGLALSVIITDLSVQKKNQQLLEENNQKLETMNHALEVSNNDLQQFASVASHDLQEPLRKIQMFSTLLQETMADTLPADKKKYLDKIIDSAGRMKTLIIDVFNYSKLSAHTKTFDKVDLNELLTELLEDFELIIREKNARIDTGILPVLSANRGQIRQVFYNIVSNALKFCSMHKSPVVKIRATLVSEKRFDSPESTDGNFCIISIKDNGIGFDEKYLNLIFTLFERLHSKNSYEGTGIGLAITKKIIEKHSGLITAKSHSGEGAEFLLLLPVEQN